MQEIEIKLRVKDLDELESKLKQQGCVLSKPIIQEDVIYGHGSFKNYFGHSKEGDIAIRIRREDGVPKITLKQQRSHEMDNTEYETEVKDGEVMRNILLLLGWEPALEVKKTRKKGRLGEYEVCLDKVEGLGSFMELEKMTDDENADAEEIRKELFEALKPFGLSEKDEETRGYDTQLYQLKNNN